MFHIKSKSDYEQQFAAAVKDPESFWGRVAENFTWFEGWKKVDNCDLSKAQVSWFEGGKTNLSYNCLDRHLEECGDKVAVIWEGNNPEDKVQKITYEELHKQVCQFANLLLDKGIQKGDRVAIYMPMVPQGLVAMLACARIGAVHTVVFAGFSAKALAGRVNDSGAKMVITADLLFRGDKKLELFEIVKEALEECEAVESVVIYQKESGGLVRARNNDLKHIFWQEEVTKYSYENEAAVLDSKDPLFILYTSGSTGKPKGILHANGGYMVYAGYSFKNVFQAESDDIFFCSADIGWITGHSYLAYGPLLNGATILMFEGVPTHPTPSRFWQIIEKHRVNIFYTAPTAIRALMQKGDDFVSGFDLSSLRILGTVGEPINEEAWQWYFDKIGNKKCSITDTWWQTETGGIMIASLAGVLDSKPAHAGFPLPGITPILFDDAGNRISENEKVGNLCFNQAWPGMALDVWGDHDKFLKTYYSQFPGNYFAGDGAFKDKDGIYRIIGRTDDVIKVSGHRLGTAEIENAINQHHSVSESAVIGVPHDIKGEAIYAFVICKKISNSSDVTKDVLTNVVKEIGAIARPEKIFIVDDLPKTRSGKIMRRILKRIIASEEDLGDISTLVNPAVVKQLQKLCN